MEQVELDNKLSCPGRRALGRIRATDQTVDWEDAKAYLKARAQRGQPSKPAAGTPGKA